VDVEARMEVVRRLCSFEPRRAGSDAERRAANWLADQLRALGRRAEIEPTYVHPQAALVHAAHCALAVAGSVASVPSPPIGFALVLVAATSMYLDLNGRLYLLRRLFFRRASQNVVSPGSHPDAPARLLICAHYDAAQSGWAFGPSRIRLADRLGRALGLPVGPSRVLFWSLTLLLPILGARLAGVDNSFLSILQLFPTLVLLVGAFALGEIAVSKVVPGANDNASGVATALALAAELGERPPRNLDVWVVLSGGQECLMEGMRGFVRSHRKELDPTATFFVNLEAVGAGELRYTVAEGLAVGFDMDRRVVELCEAIATADREAERRFDAEPLRWGYASDALPLRLARYPGTTITATAPGTGVAVNYHLPSDAPDALDPAALERAHGFALALFGQLDQEVGWRVERGSAEYAVV
jgi:peptidase M28-like protein